MRTKLGSFFVYAAGAILLITGMAKLIGGFGSAKLLDTRDPVVAVPARYLMLGAACLELIVAGIVLFHRTSFRSKVYLIAWIATALGLYRVGLWLSGAKASCPCLGGLTDTLHIPMKVADATLAVVLAFLLAGSYLILGIALLGGRAATTGTSGLKSQF